MVRLAILAVLLCLTVWEWRTGPRKAVYWLSLFSLFLFFSFRYGQGTDYLTYLSIYANVSPLYTFPNYLAFQYNKIEVGFFYLMSFFRMFGTHYSIFIAIITLFSLTCIHRFISRFASQLPMFALTLFFAIYSITYMESGIRQLISISIALGWVYIDWMNGKRLRAVAGIVIAMSMHTSAALLFLLPVMFWNPRRLFILEWKRRTTALVFALMLGAALIINFVDFTPIINLLPASVSYTIRSYYTENNQVSLLALGNRTLFMAIVFVLAWKSRGQLTNREKFLFNLYCVGYALYVLFMPFDLIASRINVYFRVVDICLLPLLFYKNRELIKRTYVGLPVLLMLVSFLYVKDISAIMDFAQYYNSNPLQYPYITIFNQDELLKSKYVNVKNANAMNAYHISGATWDEYYETLQRKPSSRSIIVPY